MELRSFSHGYGQVTYHIVLVPKYRYRIFYDKRVKKDCELILKNICMEQEYKIHALELVEDHVHLFLEFHPSTSLSKAVQYLKGGSWYNKGIALKALGRATEANTAFAKAKELENDS